jgi:hypothetical protein
VGTIIKREAMKKQMNYKSLLPSDIALVDCGLNCIIDLTRGSLTRQHMLFSKDDWSQIKSLFAAAPNNDGLVKSRPALQKIDRIFNVCIKHKHLIMLNV